MKYIYEREDWPHFHWSAESVADRLAGVRHRQGRLIGPGWRRLASICTTKPLLSTLTEEVVKSSDIEGEVFNHETVRYFIARQIGIAIDHPHLLAIFSRNDGEVRLIGHGHGRGDENPAGQ